MYKIQYCINNTYNRSIKSTPSKILFGLNQHGESNDYLRLILEDEQNQEGENRDFSEIRNSAHEIFMMYS